MTDEIGWHYPSDESDQWDGFNDSGIEHFRGSPILHLAREINQNALDAAESDSATVEVRFQLHEIENQTIPGLDELTATIESCLRASEEESQKAKTFFQNALKTLRKKKVPVLEISDHNTRGMRGPSQNGTPFYAFIKAKGQSKKESDTATGSYGIGKFAPYAVSNARTIFVSTVYQDDEEQWGQLTQGKSILMSHDIEGKRKQGIGFWGVINKCQPVEGVVPQLPEWLQRATREKDLPQRKGSKISIICFDVVDNWEDLLAVSVAENFFGAISTGQLRVDISGKHVLDQNSIEDFFSDNEIKRLIENTKSEPEQFENCRNYLEALRNKTEAIVEESQMRELGLCQVRILLGEGLPKKVCVLRNGMFITDSLNRLKMFSDFKEFVAVVQCKSPKGNELLRAMEPPKHDDFEPDRLSTKEDQRRGNRALRDLAGWIRDMLKRHAKDPVSEVTELDELKDFFGDEGDEGTGKGVEEVNPYGRIIIRAKPLKPSVHDKKIEADEEEGGGGGTGKGGGDRLGGAGGGIGGSGGNAQRANIDLNNVRTLIKDSKSRRIAFTPVSTGRIALHLLESGADTDYSVAIVKSDRGSVKNGNVVMDVTAGTRYDIAVELNEDFPGAVKVVAHEI